MIGAISGISGTVGLDAVSGASAGMPPLAKNVLIVRQDRWRREQHLAAAIRSGVPDLQPTGGISAAGIERRLFRTRPQRHRQRVAARFRRRHDQADGIATRRRWLRHCARTIAEPEPCV